MLKKILVTHEDDHIYYNVDLYNNTNYMQPASFIDRRSIPIVDKCDNYHLSIIRFTVPTYNIPIILWPGNDFFYIRLTDGAKSITAPVLLLSNNDPIFADGIFEYNVFINLINNVIANIFIDNPPWSFTQPPYLYLNPSTQLTIYAPEVFRTSPATVNLSFNLNLYKYFDTLEAYYPPSPQNFTTDFAQIVFSTYPLTNTNVQNPYIPGSTLIAGVLFNTTVTPLLLWPTLKNIVFTSGGIPIKEEYIQNKTNDVNTNLRILTDFEPLVSERVGDSRSVLQYNATIYRKIDLISTEPLKNIDISIYWTAADGSLRPLYIAPRQYLSAKILFSRKDNV